MFEESLGVVAQLITTENMLIVSLLTVVLIVIHMTMYRQKKQALLQYLEEKIKVFQNVFYISEDAIVILSNTNEILFANQAATELFGLKKYFKFTALQLPEVKDKEKYVALNELIRQSIQKSEKRMHVFSNTTLLLPGEKAEEIPANLYFNNADIHMNDNIPGTIVVINDLRKEREKERIGFRHKLTELPNQSQLISDLNALYGKLHLHEQNISLVLMDIDNFSTLRSIVGYEQSNVVLIKFANYLKELAEEFSFSVYHTAHNNFLLLLTGFDSSKDILSIVNTIQNELKSFYKMGKSKLHLTASVGISVYPDKSSTLNLLDDAYKALSSAEKSGHGRIEIYEQTQANDGYDELQLYNDMHQGLEKNEFEVYYQPIVSAKDQEIVSAEALIRWNHPEHGMISPFTFIPIMEKTGFIIDLGKYVLEEVLKQQKRWELFKFKQISISINLSMLELESGKFVDHVVKQLTENQVSPELIKFEITEGSAMISEETTRKQLLELKRLGIDISLDDFGTGYTSFTYLKKIPANILKIDRSLVINIVRNEEDQRIVKAMIDLGHNLGMKIVVEGIENEKMHKVISEFGCDFMQGYHFARPLPVFEFQKLLR